jgi:glycosyltransferase involved in cell wall biosynthesis
MGPRDPRAVLFFQDMFHFRLAGRVPVPTREWIKNRARASWRRLSAGTSKLAISVSHQVLREVQRRVRIPSVVVPNGVDVGTAWWTGEQNHVFVLGGSGARKDEQTAVRAWALVASEQRRGLELRIGGVEPASRREHLRRLAHDLGLGGEITIVGTLSRDAYLENVATARVVISCSRLEAFSLPVAESLAMGAPLLCTAIQSHLELADATGAGVSFRPRDFTTLAHHLSEALSGKLPRTLSAPPTGWSWRDRARQHVNAYAQYF